MTVGQTRTDALAGTGAVYINITLRSFNINCFFRLTQNLLGYMI